MTLARSTVPLTLEHLNASDTAGFVTQLEEIYGASWVPAAVAPLRPFTTIAELRYALVQAVRAATRAQQAALIQAFSDMSSQWATRGLAAARGHRVASSTEAERAICEQLRRDYAARFGWPCVVALCGPRGIGLSPYQHASTLGRRLKNHAEFEFAECLREVHRIAEVRLSEAFGVSPVLGNQVWDWADELAQYSDPGFKEHGQLTVTYLTEAHRACADRLCGWMNDVGFDHYRSTQLEMWSACTTGLMWQRRGY